MTFLCNLWTSGLPPPPSNCQLTCMSHAYMQLHCTRQTSRSTRLSNTAVTAASAAEQATVAEQYVQHDWAQMASTSDGEPGSLSKATIAVLKVLLMRGATALDVVHEDTLQDLLSRPLFHPATHPGVSQESRSAAVGE